jgi:hypothetical protein
MADQNQVERVQQDAVAWNTWRKQHPDGELDLREPTSATPTSTEPCDVKLHK